MVGALVLIGTKPGAMEEAMKEIEGIEDVQMTKMLTGPYDIMAVVKGESMKDIINTAVEKIRTVSGVNETTTNIFIDEELGGTMADVLKSSK